MRLNDLSQNIFHNYSTSSFTNPISLQLLLTHSHLQPATPSPIYPIANYETTWSHPLTRSTPPPPCAKDHDQDIVSAFTASFLTEIKAQSCSRANFAAKLAKTQFTEEERKSSNVKGVLRKKNSSMLKSY